MVHTISWLVEDGVWLILMVISTMKLARIFGNKQFDPAR